MPKEIGSPAPAAIPVALLVALAVILAAAPAQAAADCVPAPGLQAPQGSHWYYRTDRATGRKCWYVSSEGRKGHGQAAPNLTTRAQLPEESPASLASETVGDPLTPSTPIEQPATPTWPVTAAGDMVQAATPTPEPVNAGKPKQAERVPAEQEQATADANVANAQHEATVQRPVAATAEMAALVGITPVSVLLLLIGVLALAGILLRRISETAVTRPLPSRPFQNDLAVVIAAARRAAPPLPPPYSPRDYAGAHASVKEESNSLRAKPRHRIEDVEEALLGVLHHWERPTASAN